MGAAMLGVLAGMAASTWVKSPREVTAESEPPPPTRLTETVDRRVLEETVVLRGTVGFDRTVDVRVRPGEGERSEPIVTAVQSSNGDDVKAGQVVAEVGGRPVVVWPGSVPTYRDLRPGAEGDDVAQLQAALENAGFGVGSDTAGVYGPGTKDAVRQFYDSIGYPVPTTGDEAEVRAAADEVEAAERVLEDARDALEHATSAAAGNADEDGATESGGGDSTDDHDAGSPDNAATDVDEATKQVERAEEDLEDAREAYHATVATSGPMVPRSEYVFLPELPARVVRVNARVGETVNADQALLVLSSGRLAVTADLQARHERLVREGQAVKVLSEAADSSVEAEVAAVERVERQDTSEQDDTASGSGGEEAGSVAQARIRGDFPDKMAGADVRVTIIAASTEEAVLVVPTTAIFGDPDGTTRVISVDGERQERVEVTTGTSADGFVEVTPAEDQTLSEGDEVLVSE
ncbi:hypothetical protein EF847_07545 [Actinobacteria bacterium YIM 96077]|uniref:Peptidoglycan binding-like domain-containing protein n=1 Tax=Phytoactinopolyspora halophila TaxID=1981511 RepID=A0A329QJW7_9ACTN|nr:peptidoglycan-binding protein [Phytoactinopolyspora halophila]AYY12581.1 hypothetical protein EF847_07545 [Actinobacteria bacterium YIM 96077]RAW12516.1 hypothetical protein DPM12_14045 [Phytoactinopolyspora halophila]